MSFHKHDERDMQIVIYIHSHSNAGMWQASYIRSCTWPMHNYIECLTACILHIVRQLYVGSCMCVQTECGHHISNLQVVVITHFRGLQAKFCWKPEEVGYNYYLQVAYVVPTFCLHTRDPTYNCLTICRMQWEMCYELQTDHKLSHTCTRTLAWSGAKVVIGFM